MPACKLGLTLKTCLSKNIKYTRVVTKYTDVFTLNSNYLRWIWGTLARAVLAGVNWLLVRAREGHTNGLTVPHEDLFAWGNTSVLEVNSRHGSLFLVQILGSRDVLQDFGLEFFWWSLFSDHGLAMSSRWAHTASSSDTLFAWLHFCSFCLVTYFCLRNPR